MATQKTIVLTSGTSWTVPDDWNSASNTINCIGAGQTPITASSGGIGGSFASIANVALMKGAAVAYSVGAPGPAGGDTWFVSTSTVNAPGGGSEASAVGAITFAGGVGKGGNEYGAGGGAAGPNGVGGDATVTESPTYAIGGTADAGMGGHGGSQSAGANGTEWGSAGSGGGGGLSSSVAPFGFAGGLYGGGGGNNGGNAGAGAPGVIVIQYTPVTPFAIATVTRPAIQASYAITNTARAGAVIAPHLIGAATFLPRGAAISNIVVTPSLGTRTALAMAVHGALAERPALPALAQATNITSASSVVAPSISTQTANTLAIVQESLPPNAALQTIIPSYLYRQYADDVNLAAFVAAHNAIAQGYLDWFNATPLGGYTSPAVSGALLDWIGQGVYGIPRPVLSNQQNLTDAGYDDTEYSTLTYNGLLRTVSGSAAPASDDIYKRVLTWHCYRGDGFRFCLAWLKNRIARFLLGANGLSGYVVSGQPSITVANGTFTVTAPKSSAYTALQLAYSGGALQFPFQYTLAFETSP